MSPTLKGDVRRRWYFEKAPRAREEEEDEEAEEAEEDDEFVIDFERHSSLVTPRPGMPLDGSMGVMPPRTQDLVVLYHEAGSEIAGMWIAPDTADLGGDPAATREGIEGAEVFKAFRDIVERVSGGEELQVHYNTYLE